MPVIILGCYSNVCAEGSGISREADSAHSVFPDNTARTYFICKPVETYVPASNEISSNMAVKRKEIKSRPENNGDKLYNGIVLPDPWPPEYDRDPAGPMPVPYLENPPSIIPIDSGRQLLVDNFLIQETSLHRTFHKPELCPFNPVLKPDRPWENSQGNWFAAPFSGGVWFDPLDKLFKMWYTAGYLEVTCYATSNDGIHWEKPDLDMPRKGTNIVLKPGTGDNVFGRPFDTNTIWLDQQENDPQARFKYFGTEKPSLDWTLVYRTSADGRQWSKRLAVSNRRIGDRTTVFYNPFRRVWVLSERITWGGGHRGRGYSESADPQKIVTGAKSVKWVAADTLDPQNPVREHAAGPGLYNLDATPYESLMLGFFSIWQGPENNICADNHLQKRNDILIGYSRDGFHWHRPDRDRFISCSRDEKDWRYGNVQSVAGGCLVVRDKLYFYFFRSR